MEEKRKMETMKVLYVVLASNCSTRPQATKNFSSCFMVSAAIIQSDDLRSQHETESISITCAAIKSEKENKTPLHANDDCLLLL